MAKVVYNNCFGSFGLSSKAVLMARDLSGNERWGDCVLKGECYSDGSGPVEHFYGAINPEVPRHDPVLVKVVETLGGRVAGSEYTELRIQDIGDSRYRIDEYDGSETVVLEEDEEWISTK